jgi:hypothetical protein
MLKKFCRLRSRIVRPSAYPEGTPQLFTRCGLARGAVRLGAPGWVGEKSGYFEHPADCTEWFSTGL